jgi:phospholipase C
MALNHVVGSKWRATTWVGVVAMMSQLVAPAFAATTDNSAKTTSPIKHVIVIIGENRSFDHVFATYKPVAGETINNLLSEKIVNEDGTPGPNFNNASQSWAVDTNAEG